MNEKPCPKAGNTPHFMHLEQYRRELKFGSVVD
jgi:hypothetical protein